VLKVDPGANGYYGYEVMDTCRPIPDSEAGNADLSLLSYLDACEQAFREYERRVSGADYRSSFQYLVFHTPFGGMVKGAHRTMMRKMAKAPSVEIDADFECRVVPGLRYCQRVGNIMGGTIFMALASSIDHGCFETPRRIGCFSYGSGCCSEFYSGVVTREGQERVRGMAIARHLDERYRLSMEEYQTLLRGNGAVKFGTRNVVLDDRVIPGARASSAGHQRLVLHEIKEFHREYEWTS